MGIARPWYEFRRVGVCDEAVEGQGSEHEDPCHCYILALLRRASEERSEGMKQTIQCGSPVALKRLMMVGLERSA